MLSTEVIEAGSDGDRPYAITADTVFYPEGGGQPSDRGTMGGVEVVDVQKTDGAIRHFLTDVIPLGPVRQKLDWARRFDHMQQHSGQHLLSRVFVNLLDAATVESVLGLGYIEGDFFDYDSDNYLGPVGDVWTVVLNAKTRPTSAVMIMTTMAAPMMPASWSMDLYGTPAFTRSCTGNLHRSIMTP